MAVGDPQVNETDQELLKFIALRYADLYRRSEVIDHGKPCSCVAFDLTGFYLKLLVFCVANYCCLNLDKVYTLEQAQFIGLMQRVDQLKLESLDEK